MENTTASETISKTYRIPEGNLPQLQHRLGKLIKRALKLGVGAIVLDVSPEVETEKHYEDGFIWKGEDNAPGYHVFRENGFVKKVLRFRQVTVTGAAPKLAGWTFVGTLQRLDGVDGNVLRTVPGHKMPVIYRSAASECEHCKFNRRRKDTFVVRKDEGTDPSHYKQVGRQCLRDFLGNVDPHQVASFAEILFSIGEACEESEGGGGGGGGRNEYLDTESFLSYVSATIRMYGWVSRKAARAYNEKVYTSEKAEAADSGTEARLGNRQTATVDDALLAMFPPKGMSQRHLDELPKPDERDMERAKAALDWAENTLTPRDDNDYEYNLKLVCGSGSGVLHYRCTGLAASLISAHMRFLGQEIERRQKAAESHHFGEVGKRDIFILQVTGLREIDGTFGVVTIVSFRSPEGNVGKWFASGSPDLAIGESYRVKGTIKKHDEWKGMKQTQLSRCTIIGKASDPEPPAPTKKPRAKKKPATSEGPASEGPATVRNQVIEDPCDVSGCVLPQGHVGPHPPKFPSVESKVILNLVAEDPCIVSGCGLSYGHDGPHPFSGVVVLDGEESRTFLTAIESPRPASEALKQALRLPPVRFPPSTCGHCDAVLGEREAKVCPYRPQSPIDHAHPICAGCHTRMTAEAPSEPTVASVVAHDLACGAAPALATSQTVRELIEAETDTGTPESKDPEKCKKCNNGRRPGSITGLIETGNNDLPCECKAGDAAEFNVVGGKRTGKQIKDEWKKILGVS